MTPDAARSFCSDTAAPAGQYFANGLDATPLEKAHKAGVSLVYGSDLLGSMHSHQRAGSAPTPICSSSTEIHWRTSRS
ncbi:hypothetical protein ACFV13_02350 [Streptomyces bauhiniae]|uniref:hypothetical protein n=1 Tax=Streptomyces bauhiniae TaxID=2340725 RepID=UPI00367756DD